MDRGRRLPRSLLLGGILLPLIVVVFSCSGCSPVYLAKAGWTELKILRGRTPIQEVIQDPETDEDTRRKLLLARQARSFARFQLDLDVGDSYTTFTRLESDTLAWVLSAAHKDRLEPKTWWFPIVGRVPYKGYASKSSAEEARYQLEGEGFDTYLRTTSAFSTLGWFADPVLSSMLRYDEVDLVETVLHELAHNHLFIPGRVRFNESFATFVGRAGAIRFFCGLEGQDGDRPPCLRARARWTDYQAFSRFLDDFVGDLQEIYNSPGLSVEEKIQQREALLLSYQDRYLGSPEPSTSPLVRGFLGRPLNNAILLARMRYFHRLSDFQGLLDQHGGDLAATVATLAKTAPDTDDPFSCLPSGP